MCLEEYRYHFFEAKSNLEVKGDAERRSEHKFYLEASAYRD